LNQFVSFFFIAFIVWDMLGSTLYQSFVGSFVVIDMGINVWNVEIKI